MGTSFGSGNWFESVTHNAEKAAKARQAAADAALRDAEVVTEMEADWLVRRLQWDKKISQAEICLIECLKAEAPGFTQGLVAAS